MRCRLPLAFLVERMVRFSLSKPGAHEAYTVRQLDLPGAHRPRLCHGLAVTTTSKSSATLGCPFENEDIGGGEFGGDLT